MEAQLRDGALTMKPNNKKHTNKSIIMFRTPLPASPVCLDTFS